MTIGANIAASLRELTDALGITQFFDIGGLQKTLLIGGETIGQEALTRFYLLHVIILPIILITLVGVHFWRIRKDGGMSRPDNADEIIMKEEGIEPVKIATERGQFKLDKNKTYGLMALVKEGPTQLDQGPDNTVMSWPTALWAEIGVFMLTMTMMTVLAYFFDAPLKEIANPSIPENPAKAPWYFLGLQELVSLLGLHGRHWHPCNRDCWIDACSLPMLFLKEHRQRGEAFRSLVLWCGGKKDRHLVCGFLRTIPDRFAHIYR